MIKLIITFLILLSVIHLNAQNYLDVHNKYLAPKENKQAFFKNQYVPIVLIGAGSVMTIGGIKKNIQKAFPNTDISIDDYLPFIPVAELYISDLAGIEHLNSVYDQTKYLFLSQFTSILTVEFLKRTIREKRPDGKSFSFPSEHATNAFVNATVLYHEFKDSSPLLSYSGFAIATITSILRVTNDQHWLPDVVAGAGIGIFVTNLVYYYQPFKSFDPFHISGKSLDIHIIPQISMNNCGFYLSYRF